MCLWYETEMTLLHICHTFVILCHYASYCFILLREGGALGLQRVGISIREHLWGLTLWRFAFRFFGVDTKTIWNTILVWKLYETHYEIYETIWLRANIESFARATVSRCTLHIAVAHCIEVNIVWRVKRLQRFQGWIQWHQPCGIQWNL
jgi:hypothetical protein